MNKTLVILKPDAVERGLVGTLISRFEQKGLRIDAAELRVIDTELAGAHYAEHVGRPFYDGLIEFISRSPSFVMVIEGPPDTWKIVRTMMGPTNPAEAPSGTIRGDFGVETGQNLVHGSDSAESASREIALFFPGLSS
jgi:nucleoside-diphosphate kinase